MDACCMNIEKLFEYGWGATWLEAALAVVVLQLLLLRFAAHDRRKLLVQNTVLAVLVMASGTLRKAMPSRSSPGTLVIIVSVTFSSGWMPITNWLAVMRAPRPEKIEWGTCRNWTMISVVRLGRRLPVRK